MEESLIEALFNNVTDLVCLAATNGQLQRVSQSWNSQLGWSGQSLEGRSLIDLVHVDDPLSDILNPVQAEDARSWSVRLRIKDATGRYRDVDWSSLSVGDDLVLAFGRMATLDLAIDDERLEPEIRLARAIDNLPVAIALYDEADRLVISNRQFEAAFSVAQVPMVPGAAFKDLVTAFATHHNIGRQESDTAQWIARRLERRQSPARGFQIRYDDDRWVELDDFLLPQGQVITVAIDISERKQAEADLRARDKQLGRLQAELTKAARLTAMAHLSSVLGHELSQPLTAIGNYTQAARRRLQALSDPCAVDSVQLLKEASEQSKRAAAILGGLKDLAQSGLRNRSREDLSTDVELAATLVMKTMDDDVELDLRLEQDLPDVTMNRVQIQQVVVNLLRNAIEAMAGSSKIIATVTSTRADPDHLEVAIADRGPGLSEAVRARLFKPFTTTKPEGTGLGLSICHSIIEAHGGTIWAEKNPGGGTRFCFRLPLTREGEEDDVA